MIDHVSVAVRDLGVAEPFYTALLATLGMAKLRDWPNAAVGFGKKHPEFWINRRSEMNRVADDSGVHICLRASDTAAAALCESRHRNEKHRQPGGSRTTEFHYCLLRE